MLRAKRLAPNIVWIDFKDWDGISKKELLARMRSNKRKPVAA